MIDPCVSFLGTFLFGGDCRLMQCVLWREVDQSPFDDRDTALNKVNDWILRSARFAVNREGNESHGPSLFQ